LVETLKGKITLFPYCIFLRIDEMAYKMLLLRLAEIALYRVVDFLVN